MRKCTATIMVLSLLASLLTVSNGQIPAVKATEEFHQGDLIIGGNQTNTIEDKVFHINGSIIVKENATLIIRNALVNFTQTSSDQFNMTFMDPINGNPRLIVENATITGNGYSLNVYFRDAFQPVDMATLNGLHTIDNIYFYFWHHARANISNSELYYVNVQHDTIIEISDSTIQNFHTSDLTSANVTNSEISSVYISGNSTVTIKNCTIDYAEIDTYAKGYIYDSVINDGYACDFSQVWLFNTTTTGTGNVSDSAVVYIGWYLDAYVTDFAGQNVPEANVTAYDLDNNVAGSKLTNAEGRTRLTLMMGFVNATGNYWTGTYWIMTYYGDMAYSNVTWVDMDENIELNIALGFFLAYPAYYNGDIILKDNEYLYIEGLLNINGSIIVEENAHLFVYNGWINFTQEADNQFNMTFKGNADLTFYNGNITANDYYFMISFENNSTATVSGLITETDIQSVHYSAADIQNSTIKKIYISHYANVTFSNCTIDQMDISGNTEILLSDSTIVEYISMGIHSANATITDLKPDHIDSWNFLQDCLVETDSLSFAPNLTITNTNVNGWNIDLYGSSNVTILRSTLEIISCHGSSKTSVYYSNVTTFIYTMDEAYCHVQDTPIQMLWLYGESEVWAFNSTIFGTPKIFGNATLYIGWWLSVHVIDLQENDVPNANVTITDSEGHPVAYGKTQTNGWIEFTLLEKVLNATGTQKQFGAYTVTATYEENSNSQQVTMKGNQQTTIQLSFIIPELSPATILLALLTIALAMLFIKKNKK